MAENATSTKQQEVIKEEKVVRKGGKKQPNEASLNMAEIRELAELVDQHGFTDFEFENENSPVLQKEHEAAVSFVNHTPGSVGGIEVESIDIVRPDGAI